jgi:hypothetical protein
LTVEQASYRNFLFTVKKYYRVDYQTGGLPSKLAASRRFLIVSPHAKEPVRLVSVRKHPGTNDNCSVVHWS